MNIYLANEIEEKTEEPMIEVSTKEEDEGGKSPFDWRPIIVAS